MKVSVIEIVDENLCQLSQKILLVWFAHSSWNKKKLALFLTYGWISVSNGLFWHSLCAQYLMEMHKQVFIKVIIYAMTTCDLIGWIFGESSFNLYSQT